LPEKAPFSKPNQKEEIRLHPDKEKRFDQRVQGGLLTWIYWLPAILWMALIFSASTDAMSSHRTSRIIGPVLRWLHPEISEETIYRVQFVIRKASHMAEYSVLATLLWIGLSRTISFRARPWNMKKAAVAFLIASVYAFSDEWHQSFVPSRQGQVTDVFIDMAGAAFGLFGLWWCGRWRRWW
jgi:VanZ family protein